MKALKTNRGWEMADDNGVFEAEAVSEVYPTKKACEAAIHEQSRESRFDESQSAISGDRF